MGKNIAIIDIESQGSSTSYSSIISIAGILVSPELEVLDKFENFTFKQEDIRTTKIIEQYKKENM